MAGMRFEGFQGLIPRTSDRLLPNMNAAEARNTKLLSGEIRGFRTPTEISDATGKVSTLRRAYRVPSDSFQVNGPDSDYVFFAPFNGASGVTSYTEESLQEAEATFLPGAALDTANVRFGTASLGMDGNTGYVTFPRIPEYNLPDGDGDEFVVQMFARWNALDNESTPLFMLASESEVTLGIYLFRFLGVNNVVRVTINSGAVGSRTLTFTIPFTMQADTWYHIAVQYEVVDAVSGRVIVWFDGARIAEQALIRTATMFNDNSPLFIGGMDEARRLGLGNVAVLNQNFQNMNGNIDSVEFVRRRLYDGDLDITVPATEPTIPLTGDLITVTPEQFLCFDSRDVDIVRSPLVNDSFDRYYYAGGGDRPMVNTAARIGSQLDSYFLGVPTPSAAPIVSSPAGDDETRAYVYTFETEFGEEGAPSPPTLATGANGTWEISNLPIAPPDAANRNITKINIYRTVPGNVSSSFFFVDSVVIGVTTYSDSETSETVASNPLLESTTFIEPPQDMEGMVVMPNGYLVGWAGRRLLFSEPFRPHAWPAEYEQSTEFEIVGLAVVGSTLVICTESQPYFGQGVSPAAFTTQKIDTVEPCLSRRGIVTTPAGAYYPSINGLVLANSSGVSVITKDLFTKAEWAALQPENIFAAQLGLQYIAFNSPNFGFIIDPENPMQRHVELDNFTNVEGIETDRYSGNVLLLANNRILEWDPESTLRQQWRWKSKVFHFPKPMNFGAGRLKFDQGEGSNALPVTTVFRPYNEELFADINALPGVKARLSPLGGSVLGGSPAKPQTGLVPSQPSVIETRQPLGGSMLYPLSFLQLTVLSVRMTVTVRPNSKTEKVVFDKQILNEDIFRMPTGFKSDLWQIELTGNTTVYSLQIAETPNGLKEV